MFYHAGNYCNDLAYIYVVVNIDSNILSRYTCLCLCLCFRRALRLLLLLLLSKGLLRVLLKSEMSTNLLPVSFLLCPHRPLTLT